MPNQMLFAFVMKTVKTSPPPDKGFAGGLILRGNGNGSNKTTAEQGAFICHPTIFVPEMRIMLLKAKMIFLLLH